MLWNQVTVAELQSAMQLCDHIGLDAFRARHGGFQAARDVYMFWHGRGPYEARPLLAAAYSHLHPGTALLTPRAFEGTNAHVFLVQQFGFERRAIGDQDR